MIIYFVGKQRFKFHEDFLNLNDDIFKKNNINTIRYENREDFLNFLNTNPNPKQKTILFNIYSEDLIINENIVKTEELYLKTFENPKVIHPVGVGRIISDKKETNKYLSKFNVLFPKIINNKENNILIFQNKRLGSNNKTNILDGRLGVLNSDDYNTKFINTTYEFKNKEYYSSIRLLCVGKKISSIFLRFRDVFDNNPNVHSKNTPLMPELINSYYNKIIFPNIEKLNHISKKINIAFGLGFYTHDLGYSPIDDEFYVFETGFKVHDDAWTYKTKPIKDEIIIDSDWGVIIKKIRK